MVLSNEPGYYREGEYGIRIENLIHIEPATVPAGGDLPMHAFSTLTFAPIDRRLVLPALLDAGETAWVDGYHAEVRSLLSDMLDAPTAAWLRAATAPLGA